MTILYAYDQTDLTSFNLNYFYSAPDFEEFNDGTNPDGWVDDYFLYEGFDAIAYYGYDFDNTGGPMDEGTVEALSQWGWDGVSEYIERWHWDFDGATADMADFYAAGSTTDLGDDLTLIKSILSGADTIYLSAFDDSFAGFKGDDTIFGFKGDDTLFGYNGDDDLFGGAGYDELWGGRGNDLLSGARHADFLDGGIGSDVLNGGLGADVLLGGAGRQTDILNGGGGKDILDGEGGDDILNGGGSKDTLRGGSGDDLLIGGRNEDVFEFSTGDDEDIIADFDARGVKHDTLDLSDVVSITNFQMLTQFHMAQVGNDVVIDAGFGDSITFLDVDIADLDQGDFIF